MTHVSPKKLPIKTEKELKEFLKEVFLNLKRSDYDKVITLFTRTEQLMLAKRLGAALMLEENIPYNIISGSLKLTDQTVAKVHFEINSQKEIIQFLRSKIKPLKRKRLFKSILKNLTLEGVKLMTKHAGGRIN